MDMMMQAALDLVRTDPAAGRPTAAGRIYDKLRQRILSLDLPPGTALLRAELAKEYDVSQTPLRDALQRLDQDGLIHIYPQSRTVVTRISLERTASAMFLRNALESEVAGALADKPEPVLIARLKGVIEMQRAIAPDTGQLRYFQELDEYFHFIMFQGVGQLDLHGLLRSRTADMDRVRRLQTHSADRLNTIVAGHEAIVAAIAAGDPQGARDALRAHLYKPGDWADEYRAQYPDYFA